MPRTQALSSATESCTVLTGADGVNKLVANRTFAPGETILEVSGIVQTVPSRYSIQIGIEQHVEQPAGTPRDEDRTRYPWRYLNHSCSPNAALEGRVLRAAKPIARLEEITFDYLTTEFDMATPFACGCGAKACVGEVRGFRHLTTEQRMRVLPRAAAHVQALARRLGLI